MNALQIESVREFMNSLLLSEKFDRFRVGETRITTFCTVVIDGKREKEFYDTEEEMAAEDAPSALLWKEIRPLVHSLIRGRKPPLQLAASLYLAGEDLEKLLRFWGLSDRGEGIYGLTLNIRFLKGSLTVTSAVNGLNPKDLSAAKEIGVLWDGYVTDHVLP